MHIILGANGHIGSALAKILLEQSEPVTVVIHSADKASDWENKGAKVEVADVHDTDDLRRIFRQGTRLFLLNPPAAPSTDTSKEERKSLFSILAALDGSGLEKVVAQSTYGAQRGESIGDLGVLYEMEQALAAQPIPATIIRGACYMSNWDMALSTAQELAELIQGGLYEKRPRRFPSLKLHERETPSVHPQTCIETSALLVVRVGQFDYPSKYRRSAFVQRRIVKPRNP